MESNSSFATALSRSRKTVVVGADEAVVVDLERIGIDLPRSCEVRVYGTCLAHVREAFRITETNTYLSDAERIETSRFLPRWSRSKPSRLAPDI